MTEPLVGRYQLIREIGRGGFGLVEEYRDLITGTDVAIKTIAPHFIKQETKRLIREVDIMSFLYSAHPHVIDHLSMFVTRCRGGIDAKVSLPAPATHKLNVLGPEYRGLTQDRKRALHHRYLTEAVNEVRKEEAFALHIVMPLMKGDLTSFIRLCGSRSEQRRLQLPAHFLTTAAAAFAFQLFFGLDYLHKCGIIHRDLKPENILVRLDEADVFASSLCIADLGLAREAQDSETFYVCTRYYRAPEVVMTAIKGHPGLDIWSMGCILYEMCTNQTLFSFPSALDEQGAWEGSRASSQLEAILNVVGTPDANDVLRYMPKGNAATYLQQTRKRPSTVLSHLHNNWILDCGEQERSLFCDLILRCLALFPQQRPTAEEACRHPLFRCFSIFFDVNVKQVPSRPYIPTFSDRETAHALTEDNKSRILVLVRQSMIATARSLKEEPKNDYREEDKEDEEGEEEVEVDMGDHYGMGDSTYGIGKGGIIHSDSSSDSDSGSDDEPDRDGASRQLSTIRHHRHSGEAEKDADNEEDDEDDDDDGGGYYGTTSSVYRIRTGSNRGSSTARKGTANQASSSANANHTNSGNGASDPTGPYVAINEEEDDDYLPAARYTSMLNLGGTTADADEEQRAGNPANDSNDNGGLTYQSQNGNNMLRAGRLQTRTMGRRQSRGSLMRINQSGNKRTNSSGSGSEAGANSGDASLTTAPSAINRVTRAPSVFFANTQSQQDAQGGGGSISQQPTTSPQQQQQLGAGSSAARRSAALVDEESDGEGYDVANASGWYSTSFFFGNTTTSHTSAGANANIPDATGVSYPPRASSGSAVVGGEGPHSLAASMPNLGLSPAATAGGFSSLSADALSMLGYHNRHQQQYQPRVSRTGVQNRSSAITNPASVDTVNASAANMMVSAQQQQQQQPGLIVGTAGSGVEGARNQTSSLFVPRSTTHMQTNGNRKDSANPSSGNEDISGLGEYDYLAVGGLDSAIDRSGKARVKKDYTDSVVDAAFMANPSANDDAFSTSARQGGGNDYTYSNVRGNNKAGDKLVSLGGGGSVYHYTSANSVQLQPQPASATRSVAAGASEQQSQQQRVQPLEPMNNNYFSAVNLGALRLGKNGSVTLNELGDSGYYMTSSSTKNQNPGTGYHSKNTSGRRANKSSEDEDDEIDDDDYGGHFLSSTSYNLNLDSSIPPVKGGGNSTEAKTTKAEARPLAALSRSHVEEEDDEWSGPLFSPPGPRSLGIGSPTQRHDSHSTGKNQSNTSNNISPESIMNLMGEVAMGAGSEVDVLQSTVLPRRWFGGSPLASMDGGANTASNSDPPYQSKKQQRKEADGDSLTSTNRDKNTD